MVHGGRGTLGGRPVRNQSTVEMIIDLLSGHRRGGVSHTHTLSLSHALIITRTQHTL